jgi:hypothetical protein
VTGQGPCRSPVNSIIASYHFHTETSANFCLCISKTFHLLKTYYQQQSRTQYQQQSLYALSTTIPYAISTIPVCTINNNPRTHYQPQSLYVLSTTIPVRTTTLRQVKGFHHKRQANAQPLKAKVQIACLLLLYRTSESPSVLELL